MGSLNSESCSPPVPFVQIYI